MHYVIDLIHVPFGKESAFIAYSDSQVNVSEKNGNIGTFSAGIVGHVTAIAVPNTKYLYLVRLIPYLN